MNNAIEQLDVLIIGAGISGLGMCYNLKKKRPQDKIAIIEGRKNFGGTWDLFRYPGIRSDSDMYTFAYSFKPWTEREYIGSAERIRNYLQELVQDEQLEQYIRFEQKALSAEWRSERNRWLVTITRSDGSDYQIEAKFLNCCTGYYNYDHGYLPQFEGYEDFQGTIAHPQQWPEDLDYQDKKVVVIGSGATAITVVPAMAEKAKHVTMLQRSPTYIFSRPDSDILFRVLSKVLPAKWTNAIMRAKYSTMQQLVYVISKRFPNFIRKLVRSETEKLLQGSADVDTHFNPSYKPWDQRMCLVPNDDLFKAIRENKVGMVTDHIDRFTEKGVLLKSGEELEADIIVPATGLDVELWGKMQLTVDGHPVDSTKLTNYKGMMFSQLPNFVWVFGYTNASWTLKAELTFDYVCRLLDHMEAKGYQSVYPFRNSAASNTRIVDLQSGYVQRALDKLPSQGESFPWCNKDLYFKDVFAIKRSKLDDGVLSFDQNLYLAPFHAAASGKSISVANSEAQPPEAENADQGTEKKVQQSSPKKAKKSASKTAA